MVRCWWRRRGGRRCSRVSAPPVKIVTASARAWRRCRSCPLTLCVIPAAEYNRGRLTTSNTTVRCVSAASPRLLPPPPPVCCRSDRPAGTDSTFRVCPSGYIKRYLASQKPSILDVQQHFEGMHKNGSLFPILITINKIESGIETSFMAVIRPFIEQQAYVTCNVDGAITELNSGATSLLGYDTAHVAGRHLEALVHPQVRAELHFCMERALADGEEVQRHLRVVKNNGTVVPAALAISWDPVVLGLKVKITRCAVPAPCARVDHARAGFVASGLTSMRPAPPSSHRSAHPCPPVARRSLLVTAVCTIDEVGNIYAANAHLSRILGYSSTAMCKMNISAFMGRRAPIRFLPPRFVLRVTLSSCRHRNQGHLLTARYSSNAAVHQQALQPLPRAMCVVDTLPLHLLTQHCYDALRCPLAGFSCF